MSASRIFAWVLFIVVGSTFAFAGPVGWRNRDNLGRSWNCLRFSREPAPNLQALHSAEHAFKKKHGHFTTDLVALGFEPKNTAGTGVAYAYGFRTPSEALAHGEDPSRLAAVIDKAQSFADPAQLQGTASPDAFLAMAHSEIFPELGSDVWTIDERGRVRHVQDGCWK